jgi:histone acetyltransferase (RNA polymerase elongator complex component)
MDYTDPVTATAAQHIENIKGLVKDLCRNYDIDFTLENLDIIEECRRAIEILRSKPNGVIYTLEFYDGLNYFEIKEGM